MRPRRRPRAWQTFLGCSLVLAAALSRVPRGSEWVAVFLIGLGLAEFVALIVGIRRYRPQGQWQWRILAAGVAFYAVANGIYFGWPLLAHHSLPFPSVADGFFECAYFCYVVSLAGMVHRRCGGRDGVGTIIDAAVIAVPLAVVIWEVILSPIALQSGVPTFARAIAVSYPIVDVALVVLLARLLLGYGVRSTAFWLFTGFVCAQTAADATYSIALLRGSYYLGHPLTIGWLLSSGCLAAAALHPSMRSLAEPTPAAAPRQMSRRRLVVFALAALAVPLGYLVSGEDNVVEIVSWTSAVFVLCICRIAVLMGTLDRSVTELRRSENELTRLACYDVLTGLPNRVLFGERLESAFDSAPATMAVMLIDLDGFKTINDSLGHSAGDALLVAIAGRWGSRLRSRGIVARLGGDEFAVLATAVTEAGAVHLALRLLRQLEDPFEIDGRLVFVRASIGIAFGNSAANAQETMRNADAAMYEAKRKGGQGYVVFSSDMNVRVLDRLALECDLRRAALGTEITVHYQPITDLASGQLTGFEALLRWEHPERGMVPPDVFVPIAEETGAIVPIGRWVLEQACAQVKSWSAARLDARPFDLNVNVSARQLAPRLVRTVAHALQETDFPPESLTLEITETMIMTDEAQVRQCLHDLKRLGVRISVDDFGTGYSSLHHLEDFPVDELKVDKSLVAGLDEDGGGSVAVAAVRLARSLRLSVVAEGIETERQLAALRRMSCDKGQGFLLGKPMAASAVEAMLATYRGPAVSDASGASAMRVLIVDDDEQVRASLARLLLGHFDTLQAATGDQALEIARRERLDAVLLDVHLPDLAGFEVCAALRELPNSPAVVHLSGSAANTSDRVRGLNAGADAYLVKPVAPEELIATLRAVIRSRLAEAVG